jgi:general secretion pathway protein B
MSYILDALRKSEQERRQTDPLVLSPIAAEAIVVPPSMFGPRAFAVMLVVTMLVFGGFWIYSANRPRVPLAATAPVTPVPSTSLSAVPPQAAAVPAPSERTAPELKPSPFIAAPGSAPVRDLAKEARVEAPVPKRASPPPSAPPAAAPLAKAAPATPIPAADPIKFLFAMPPEFQRALPELNVNIHIYAPRDVDRILYINNRQYQAGDRVREDILLEEIVPDGALMNYRGQRFKLPRPR